MAELFPGPGVRITHDVVETAHQTYPVSELSLLHVIHEAAIDVAIATPTARVCSGAATVLAAVVAAAGSELFNSPQATVVGTMVALAAGATTVRGWRVARRPRSLWAYHGGRRVCLYVGRDELVFRQVLRALQRAIEAAREIADDGPR
jgi:hypothetical protein